MLKRFLNPRWEHPDPEVRREAVALLNWGEDAQAIAQVAREDELPALRLLALRHSPDLDLLLEREREDADAAVRKEATVRFRQVLAGFAADGPPLAERLLRAARIDDVALLEFLAREGKDDALRAQALARVERESVLRDVALKDPSRELRLEALERIQDEGVLARIVEQSRKSDKQVSRRARERLQANKAQRELPETVGAQCLQICVLLESLGRDGYWNRDEDRFTHLENRWQALEPQFRRDYEERFESARRRFRDTLAAQRNAAPPIRAAMEALIARLRAAAEATADENKDLAARIRELESLPGEVDTAWQRLEPLADVEEQRELQQRYVAATQALKSSIATQRRGAELSSLRARYERLAARKGAIAEGDVKALEREREALPAQPATAALKRLERRIDKAHGKLRDRLREQASWKDETLAALPARLDALKKAVADGQAREAIALHDEVATDVEALCTMGASRERMATHQSRLRAFSKDVQVMRAWGRFGATRALEGLCEQMEALKESTEHPPEIASKVRAARDAWKKHSAKGSGADQALWRRFDTAATEAYLPCKAFFEERARERKANLERRRQLIGELRSLLDSSAGRPGDDWKRIVRGRAELLGKWHRAHPVDRKGAKAVAEEFDACMAELEAMLGRERERCVRQREQLISDAEALAENPDKKATAESCKLLQRQWVVTVPGSRSEENALWERFRGACDRVFAERQQVFDAERESARAGTEARKALCQRVEALLAVSAEGLEEAERELHRVQGEWGRIERPPKREGEALESRFNTLVRRFAKHKRGLAATLEQAHLALMRNKAMLCHEAEAQQAVADTASLAQTADELRSRWLALPALADDKADAALHERFERALQTQDAAADTEQQAENLRARESLCLRLEILVGVDSPPEHAQARMAQQVARLSSALKERSDANSESADDLLRAWCLLGPAPAEQAAALETRFDTAWAARRKSPDAKPASSQRAAR